MRNKPLRVEVATKPLAAEFGETHLAIATQEVGVFSRKFTSVEKTACGVEKRLGRNLTVSDLNESMGVLHSKITCDKCRLLIGDTGAFNPDFPVFEFLLSVKVIGPEPEWANHFAQLQSELQSLAKRGFETRGNMMSFAYLPGDDPAVNNVLYDKMELIHTVIKSMVHIN